MHKFIADSSFRSILLACVASAAVVSAQGVPRLGVRWDQQAPGAYRSGTSVAALVQEFRPATAALDVIDLFVNTQSATTPARLRLRLRESGPTGKILATSDIQTARVAGVPVSRRRFTFAQPVRTVPGQVYAFEILNVGSAAAAAFYSTNTYNRGRLLRGGVSTGRSLWFRTGLTQGPIAVPDQVNDGAVGSSYNTWAFKVAQEFQANTYVMDGVELAVSNPGTSAAGLQVQIRLSGHKGPVIATSETAVVEGKGLQVARFAFDGPISTFPGVKYAIEVRRAYGAASVHLTSWPNYSGGSLFVDGKAVTGSDLWFRTGMAADAMVVDQFHEEAERYYDTVTGFVGQEFTPAAAAMDVVELKLRAHTYTPGRVRVRVRRGTPTGPIVGVSQPETVSVISGTGMLERFFFAQPVPLWANSLYVLEVEHLSGGSVALFYTTRANYSRGAAIVSGTRNTGRDYWFRCGLTPSPVADLDQDGSGISFQSYAIPQTSGLGQEFQPKYRSMDAMELFLSSAQGGAATVKVRVREGSITGRILGESEAVSLASSVPLAARFRFAQPCPLAPAQRHVFEVVHVTGATVHVGLGNNYWGGRCIAKGKPVTQQDLWFRTGRETQQTDAVLWADRYVLGGRSGGWQEFAIDAGRQHAGRSYWIFGSITGTTPGVRLNGISLPLNPDAYTDLTISLANSPMFQGFRGKLDASGRARAALRVPADALKSGAITLHHACLVFDNTGWHLASDAIPTAIR